MSTKFFEKILRTLPRHKLIRKIANGIRNNEFKMYLQFIVDSKTKKIASAEALSRWVNPTGEVVFPGDYIGVMETSGLIIRFDYYMFENVCKKLAQWKGTEFDQISISCNITRITICEKNFADIIKYIASKYDFDRSKLIIEITEDCIEKNFDDATRNILKVKELGFTIALDDIGGGYTSLINLLEYPIDVAKIERNVLLLADSEKGEKLFLGVSSLFHDLGLKVVCEGVETQEQNTLVSNSSCDYIQGWYYAKALSETAAEDFAKEYMNKF